MNSALAVYVVIGLLSVTGALGLTIFVGSYFSKAVKYKGFQKKRQATVSIQVSISI